MKWGSLRTVVSPVLMVLLVGLALGTGCSGSDDEDSGDGDGDGDAAGDRSCEDLCTDAQAGQCTDIGGDCGEFCDALDTVAPDANCVDEQTAYIDCLNQEVIVCDSDCTAEEVELSTCVGIYCFGDAGNPDCATLAASLEE